MKRAFPVLGLFVVCLFVLAFGATWAAADADDDGVIHACIKRTGKLRIVDSADDCEKREAYLAWNLRGRRGKTGAQGEPGPQGEVGLQGERGPQGEQGPQGESGSQGEPGPQGEPGLASVPGIVRMYVVGTSLEQKVPVLPGQVSIIDRCDIGDIAISAGYYQPEECLYLAGSINEGGNRWHYMWYNECNHEVNMWGFTQTNCLDLTADE